MDTTRQPAAVMSECAGSGMWGGCGVLCAAHLWPPAVPPVRACRVRWYAQRSEPQPACIYMHACGSRAVQIEPDRAGCAPRRAARRAALLSVGTLDGVADMPERVRGVPAEELRCVYVQV